MITKIKIAISYLLCLFIPKSFEEVINDFSDSSDLDALILQKSGIK